MQKVNRLFDWWEYKALPESAKVDLLGEDPLVCHIAMLVGPSQSMIPMYDDAAAAVVVVVVVALPLIKSPSDNVVVIIGVILVLQSVFLVEFRCNDPAREH
jgi:hypothetical protein